MAVSPAAKVGIVTTAGIVALGVALTWLTGIKLGERGFHFTVTYNDVSGLLPGAPVMLMGVKVGQVNQVVPEDRHVNVEVDIFDTRTRIDEHARFKIMSQGLIGEKSMEIFPPASNQVATAFVDPGDRLRGDDPARFELAMEEVTQAFREFQRTTDPKKLQAMFNQTAQNLLDTTETVKSLGGQASGLMTDLSGTVKRIDQVLVDVDRVAVAVNPAEIAGTVRDVRLLSSGLLNTYGTWFGTPESQAANQKTIHSIQSLATQLEQIATTLNGVTGDPAIQRDVKEAISNLNELTRRVTEATAPIKPENIAGGLAFSPRLQAVVAHTPSGTGLAGNLALRTKLPNNYFQVGIEQIGEGNYFDLFFGNERQWADTTGYRFGLIRSKIGVGIDHELTRQLTLSGELYDPFRPTFRLGATFFPLSGDQYGLTAQWAREFQSDLQFLWLGLEWRPMN